MIRLAHAEELPLICSTMAAMNPWKRLELPEQRLLEAATTGDPLRQTWVYAVNKEICGVIMYREHHALQSLLNRGFDEELSRALQQANMSLESFPDGAYVNALAVFPEYQNKNIGQQLLRHAEAAAAPLGNIYLCVSKPNPRAQTFYERNGYRCIAHIDNCLRPGNVEHLMQKRLPEA